MTEIAIDWKKEGFHKLFYEWCKEVGLHEPIAYEKHYDKHEIVLMTTRPGAMIGCRGKTYDKYLGILHKIHYGIYKDYEFKIIEIRGEFLNYIDPTKKKRR